MVQVEALCRQGPYGMNGVDVKDFMRGVLAGHAVSLVSSVALLRATGRDERKARVYTYAYLVGSLFWLAAWLVMYVMLPRHRPAMLWTGLLLASAGPISEYWSLQDYWHPVYIVEISIGGWRFGPEDCVLSFTLTGVCAGVFEAIAEKRGLPGLPRVTFGTMVRVMGWAALGLVLMIGLDYVPGLHSMRSLLLAVAVVSLLMLVGKPRVLRLALPLAVVFAMLDWVLYWALFARLFPGVFEALWKLEQTWGVAWLGVPIEEVLWAGFTMLFAGTVLRASVPKEQVSGGPGPHGQGRPEGTQGVLKQD